MSMDEVEKFEITDYDLENEFNIYRPRRNLTKHQQIYGIWADDSDNEEQSTSKSQRNIKDYSLPIGFVSGGVQQSGKNKKNKKRDGNEESEKSEDEDARAYKKKFLRHSSSGSDSDTPTMGTGFRKSTESTVTEITGDIAGLRNGMNVNKSTLSTKGVGNWEKHTKGIGAKLLLQMGYQPGKGLGKDLQGISAPVEAHMRKGRGAIGAYGPEKLAKIAEKELPPSKQETKNNEADGKWKKNPKDKNRMRYYYRSVNDVIDNGKATGSLRIPENTSELSKVKVIDMTGPNQRVLSGYHALSGPKAPEGVELFEDIIHKQCANFAVPEIQHNLNLLVNMCEEEIILCNKNSRYCEDRIILLNQEEAQLKNVIKKEDEYIETLENVLDIVNTLIDQKAELTLGQIVEIFKNMQEKHFEEYTLYELGELAPGLVGPLITSALASWSPLTSPKENLDIYQEWKSILNTKDRAILDTNNGIPPYDALVWNTWIPPIQCAITLWNARECDPLINLLEIWQPVISQWIFNNVLDQYVIPRLTAEISIWNPLTDITPIHVWIHPWIPLIDARIHTTLFPLIQEKLGTALVEWHPSDKSAKLLLKPWQAALPEGIFAAFLYKYILPKLQICMQTFVINPHQQHLDAWDWVMDWSDVLNIATVTHMLDKYFFPRWLQTLALWLNHSPDFLQVTEWYSGWKRMLSENLLMQPIIKDYFHKALDMMNRSVGSGQQPGALESVSYLRNIEDLPQTIQSSRTDVILNGVLPKSTTMATGFKELIAKRCEERGILFLPIRNRFQEAKQVYRIGAKTLCYIDRNVIFTNQNGISTWIPTSLAKLLEMGS